MGLRYIFGVLAAVVSISALAADPPVPRSNVSVNVNPTTGYYSVTNSTLRLPNGVSVSPSAATPPVVSKYSGGLQQTIPTGITIDAIKKSAPLPAVVRSTTQSVKGAAARCLKSGRCNLALLVAGEGLSQLFDGLDWVMGEGGKIQHVKTDTSTPDQGGGMWCIDGRSCSGSPSGAVAELNAWLCPGQFQCPYTYMEQTTGILAKGTNAQGGVFNIYRDTSIACESPYAFNSDYHCVMTSVQPVSDSDIDSGVADNYTPEPSDWPALTPELELDDVEITSSPTLQGEPKTTTVFDADGNPYKVTETNTWYDFDIRDNPSPSPALDLKAREETKTYEDGVLTGTTTTDSTASGGSGGSQPPEVDIPTDCDFMPTVCAFLEWYRDDDPPEEPDLSVLLDDRDFTESYTITGGSKQCPPPYELALSFIGQTYYLSFDFACDFASKFYYFVMAAAYIFAAYITIGVARNG